MNVFGIALTPGHLIIATALVVLYDALWTWAFSNNASSWWFERVQGFLKVAIYLGALTLVVLVVYTPWPWNLVLVLSTALSVGSILIWLKNRAPKEKKK